MTIVLISDGELEHAGCQHLAAELRRLGRPCLTVATPLQGLQPLPVSPADLTIETPGQLLTGALLLEASAIGLFLRNPADVAAFIRGYRARMATTARATVPLLSGPLRPLVGDALMEDVSHRLNADLLVLSGPVQHEQLRASSRHWPAELQPPAVVTTGFWFPMTAPDNAPRSSKLLVALIQQDIPSHPGARHQLIRQLQRWANQHPDWTIVLQRDHGWPSGQPLLGNASGLPTNLVEAAPGQMLELLARCNICLSVSSPWSLAAICWGAQALMVGDYGIQAEQDTVGWFGCGAMHRLRDINNLNALQGDPAINRAWLEGMGGAIGDGAERLLQGLEAR